MYISEIYLKSKYIYIIKSCANSISCEYDARAGRASRHEILIGGMNNG